MLYALPKTPLWDRLEAEGRLRPTADVEESNVVFKLPAETVMSQWRRVVDTVFEPKALYRRYGYNIAHTYGRRKALPLSRFKLSFGLTGFVALSLLRILFRVGIASSYRRSFWSTALTLVRGGRIDQLIYIAAFGHHMIRFRDDVLAGAARASYFNEKVARDAASTPPAGRLRPESTRG